MEDLQELNNQIEAAKNLANKNKTDAKDLLGEKAILDEHTVEKFMDGYNVPHDDILIIEDWNLPAEEMFPLVHVAKLGSLDIYTREMSVKDMSDYIESMKNMRNDIDFMGKTICKLALLETGRKAFPEAKLSEVLSKKQEMVTKLYLKLVDAAKPKDNKKDTQEEE